MNNQQSPKKTPASSEEPGAKKYSHDSDVEEQIREVLVLEPDRLLVRARGRRGSPDFIREETLVYMIRELLKDGSNDELLVNLVEILERRARDSIHNSFLGLNENMLEHLEDNVISKFLEVLFTPPHEHEDFMEAKFLRYIRFRATDERRRFGDEGSSKYQIQSLTNADDDALDISGLVDGQLSADPLPIRKLEDLAFSHHIKNEILPTVITNPSHLEVFVLREYYSWPIESRDNSKQTLATHFGVEPRTIRNWLKTAENQLESWRKGPSDGEETE